MKRVYEKPFIEVVDFQNEAVMSDGEIVFSLAEGESIEDGGEY